MNQFEHTLNDVNRFCNKFQIDYTIMGGIALIAHGINRTTQDIDINLLVNLKELNIIANKIISEFSPIFSEAVSFFQTNFVLPVKHKETGIEIDFTAGLTEFDKQAISRKEIKHFGSLELPFCSIEDLIIYKLFAARLKDLADLESIANFYKDKLDVDYLVSVVKSFDHLDRKDMFENLRKMFL